MDASQILRVLGEPKAELPQYTDAQWCYLQDNNNMSYTNNIQFITTSLKTQFIDYHNAYLSIPITVGSSVAANPYNLNTNIAFRESVLSLISNIQISTDQGQTLVSDMYTHFSKPAHHLLIPTHLAHLQPLVVTVDDRAQQNERQRQHRQQNNVNPLHPCLSVCVC